MKNKAINIVLRKTKKDNSPQIFYRELDYRGVGWGWPPLTVFDGCHSSACLDYYHKDTKPATEKECEHLLSIFKTYLEKGEFLKFWKKLNFNNKNNQY